MQHDNLTPKQLIGNEFNERAEELQRQIESITVRQTEILTHIKTLESAINFLRQNVKNERDHKQRARYYELISHNIELLSKLYSVWKEFEDVKNRYYREGNNLLISKVRILNIELEKLEKDVDDSILLYQAINELRRDNVIDDDSILKDKKYQI